MAVATAPSGVAVTDLPLKERPAPEAEKPYREGLQAFRAGLPELAVEKFEAAVRIDSSFAAGNLRIASTKYWLTIPGAREPYIKASQLRDKLTDRDKAMLTGLEACILPELPDYPTCANSLARASSQFPLDAELRMLWGGALGVAGDAAAAVAKLSEALALDPHFAANMGLKSQIEAYLGDFEQAIRTTDACLADSPGAEWCLLTGIFLGDQNGDRARFASGARALWIAGEQANVPMPAFADALFVAGESRDAVLDALLPYWQAVPERHRAWTEQRDRAALGVLDGDFAKVSSALERINESAIKSDEAWRWIHVTELWLDSLAEQGDRAGAARIATQLRSRLAGLAANPNSEDWGVAEEPLPMLLEAQVRGGAITKDEYAAARNEWVAAWKKRVKGWLVPFVWVRGYAAHLETSEEANTALDRLTEFGAIPPFHPLTATNYPLGKMFHLAGRHDEARRYLDRAVNASSAIEYPFAFVRSHLYRGMELASQGDKDGACAEFQSVIARWGKAKPRSVTADDARKRARALGCSTTL